MSDAYDLLRDDPDLGPYVEAHGALELEPAEDPFRRLVVSVINQQLSTQSAAAIRDRLFERFTIDPETMLAADEAALREVGLSGQKIDYVRSIAERFEADRLSMAAFEAMDDDAVIEELTSIHGIGVWTAKMFLIFVLAREDVFPVEDLGIRRGMEELFGEMSRADMRAKAEDWRPYRSYASLYIWRAYD